MLGVSTVTLLIPLALSTPSSASITPGASAFTVHSRIVWTPDRLASIPLISPGNLRSISGSGVIASSSHAVTPNLLSSAVVGRSRGVPRWSGPPPKPGSKGGGDDAFCRESLPSILRYLESAGSRR